MVHLFVMALLTGIADSNLSLQQTWKTFTAMLSFLPLFTLTPFLPFLQLELPPSLKMTRLSKRHLFNYGRREASVTRHSVLQPSHQPDRNTHEPRQAQQPPPVQCTGGSPLSQQPQAQAFHYLSLLPNDVSDINMEDFSSLLFLDVKIT